MSSALDRRTFLRLCSACAAFLTQAVHPQQKAAQERLSVASERKGEVKHRKNFVALQVKPFSFYDEGVDKVLDNLQQKGNVNTIFSYTFDYEETRLKKNGEAPLPDHGVEGGGLVGGAFYDYDPKYFRNTILKDFRSQDFGKFNVIAEVAQKAKSRGMDYFAWDYNNSSIMSQHLTNFAQVAEIDIYGMRTTNACFNHPEYRAFLTGKIESLLSGYADDVSGIAWVCERMGPFHNMIGGGWSVKGIGCFCQFCKEKGRERGISVQRAREGYQQLDRLFGAAAKDERPSDGYFVAFWRLLLKYPEILSWETLWNDTYHEVRAEVYGTAKAIAPEKPFGFHIQQNMTFSPFYRAEEDFSETRRYSDFLKLATYNNSGGPRMAAFLDRLSATVFHDAKPEDFERFYYKIMNYQEPPYEQLHLTGLSADYVARETKRAIAGVRGEVQVYPGIDIDVPTRHTDHRTKPDDVRQAIRAAFGAGADGVVLSTRYEEMWLANLTAAGDTLREVFANARST